MSGRIWCVTGLMGDVGGMRAWDMGLFWKAHIAGALLHLLSTLIAQTTDGFTITTAYVRKPG